MRRMQIRLAIAVVMGFLSCSPTMAQQGFYGRTRYAYSKTVGDFDFITMNDGGGIGASPSGPRWIFDSSNGDITTLHNVGIGTDAPAKKLHIVEGDFRIQKQPPDTAIGNAIILGIIEVFGDDDTANADEVAFQIKVTSNSTWIDGEEDGRVEFSVSNGGVLNINQLLLSADGNVLTSGDFTIDATFDAQFIIDSGGATRWALLRYKAAGVEKWVVGRPDDSDYAGSGGDEYMIATGETATPAVWIEPATNNVGLGGTTDPNYTLDVDGDIQIEDIIDGRVADVMYPGKAIIKTFGIAGSGLDFTFSSVANVTEQQLDLGAILPAGCVIVSVVLECDVTVTDGADQAMSIDVGITSGTAALLTASDTDSDGQTNVTGVGLSPVLGHSTSARNVWANAIPGVNWSTLTGGEWSIIIRYDDLGAVRAQKGL